MKFQHIILAMALVALAFLADSCEDSLGIDKNVLRKAISPDTTISLDTLIMRDTIIIRDTIIQTRDSLIIRRDTIFLPALPKTMRAKRIIGAFYDYYDAKMSPDSMNIWPYVQLAAEAVIDTTSPIPLVNLNLVLRNADVKAPRRTDYVLEFKVKLDKYIPSFEPVDLTGDEASGRWAQFTMGGYNLQNRSFDGINSCTVIPYSRLITKNGKVKTIAISFLTTIANLHLGYTTSILSGTIYIDLF